MGLSHAGWSAGPGAEGASLIGRGSSYSCRRITRSSRHIASLHQCGVERTVRDADLAEEGSGMLRHLRTASGGDRGPRSRAGDVKPVVRGPQSDSDEVRAMGDRMGRMQTVRQRSRQK